MEKTLKSSYCWSFEEFRIVNSLVEKTSATLGGKLSRWFLGLFFLIGVFYSLFKSNEDVGHRVWGVFIFSALAFFIVVYPGIRKRKYLRKFYQKSKIQDEAVAFEIKEETVTIEGPLASANASWEAFENATITPLGILLTDGLHTGFWLPKHCFAEREFEQLTELVRKKIKNIKVLTRFNP